MAISEFQLALIGAGVTATVGVWAYNSWQEYRQRKAADTLFRGNQHDVLVEGAAEGFDEPAPELVSGPSAPQQDDERIEPVFTAFEPVVIANVAEDIREREIAPDIAEASEEEVPPHFSALNIPTPSDELLDPMIEFALALPSELSVAASQLEWRKVDGFRKPIRWVAHDSSKGVWFDATSGDEAADATSAHVAIQLADRQGCIDKAELAAFCQAAEAVAAAQSAVIGIPAIDEVYVHACALDEICASVDIQIAIHIVGRTGQFFAGSKLRGLLEAAGFQLAPDGLFYLSDDKGRRLVSVCQSGTQPFEAEQMRTGAVPGITFWLDVPRVTNGAGAFDSMLTIARRLVVPLDGVLVDDQRNPLADTALSSIRAKIVELQSKMGSQGIPAGGRRALRLFS